MAYTRVNWEDLPSTNTPRNATNLNNMDAQIKENDDKLLGTKPMGSIVVDDVNCKNMFDKGSFVSGDRKDAQPTIRISSRQVLYLEPGTYTFSTNLDTSVYRYEINTISSPAPVSSYDVLYGSGWKTTSTLTFTVDNSTKGYFNLGVARINNSSLTISDISSANFQLEKGSTATNYVSYKQPVKKTSIGVKESCTFYADDFKCKNLFIPTKTNNGTNIALYQATLNMEDDEFVFTATGTAIYFGNVKAEGADYTDDRGVLIDIEGISSISYTLTNPLFNQTYITAYDSSKKSLGYVYRNLSSGSYDIPAGTKYITFRFGINNTTSGTTYRTKVQLEVGSEATSYTPYKRTIKEQNGYVKEDTTFYANDFKCKNLFTSSMQLGSLDNNTGEKASSTDAIRTEFFIEVAPNTTYTISNNKQYHIYTYEYNSSHTFIKYTGSNTDAYKSKVTITTSSTTKYIKIRTVVSSVENDLTSKWQLEVGGEVTPYTPYKKFENDLGNQFKFVTQINNANSLTYSFTDDDAINKCYLLVISKGPSDGTFGGMWFIRRGATASAKICQTGPDNVTMSVSISGNTITCSFNQWANYCRMNVYQIMVAS